MARIRSIKPQFWTSEQIAECSPNARLTFIGMWNFCDDYGVHPASPARLKMEVFPADAFTKEDISSWMQELISQGLVIEYEAGNALYWLVTGWHKHQKIDSPTGQYPMPDGNIGAKIRRTPAERSPNDTGTSADHSPLEKEKEKEKEKEIASSATADKADAHKTSRKIALTDDEFISSLEANPAYNGIDVRREYGKMCAWLASPRGKGKFPTRQRFLNWLNRCDPTMATNTDDNYDPETGGHKHVVL